MKNQQLVLIFIFMAIILNIVEASEINKNHNLEAFPIQNHQQNQHKHQYWEMDPLCKIFKQRKCVKCAFRAYFVKGKCTSVSNQCKTFDQENGQCQTCYTGYKIRNKDCVIQKKQINSKQKKDSLNDSDKKYHKERNTDDKKNEHKKVTHDDHHHKQVETSAPVIPVSTVSLISSVANKGFAVENNNCVPHDQPVINNADDHQIQVQTQTPVIPVSTVSQVAHDDDHHETPVTHTHDHHETPVTHDDDHHIQTSTPVIPVSIVSSVSSVDHDDDHHDDHHTLIDPLCHEWHDNICVECSDRAYFGNDHRCIQSNPLCNTFDRHNGACLTCYKGFAVENNNCVPHDQPVINNADDHQIQVQTQTPVIPVSTVSQVAHDDDHHETPVTHTHDHHETPVTHDDDHHIQTSTPVIPVSIVSSVSSVDHDDDHHDDHHTLIDPLCHEWHDNICVECSDRAYFGNDHRCIQSNPLCNTFDRHNGACLTCYKGFLLQHGNCLLPHQFNTKNHNSHIYHNKFVQNHQQSLLNH